MTRKELLRMFHQKVIGENIGIAEELDLMKNAPHYITGPFPDDNTWPHDLTTERDITPHLLAFENLDLLESDDPPEKVIWGIGEEWEFQVTIPKNATQPEHCSCA